MPYLTRFCLQQPNQSKIEMATGHPEKYLGYYKICRHYKWALDYVVNELGYQTVIITEGTVDFLYL